MKSPLLILLMLVSFIVSSQPVHAQESDVFGPITVLSNGADAVSDDAQRFTLTVGQPVVGIISSESNTNALGFWYVAAHGAMPETIDSIEGDTTGDGIVNVADLIQLINVILGVGNPPTEAQRQAADVNDDGILDVNDLIAIINMILGRWVPDSSVHSD